MSAESSLSGHKDKSLFRRRPRYFLATTSFVAGMLFLTANNLFYAVNKESFFDASSPPFSAYFSLVLILCTAAFFAVAVFSYISVQRKMPPAVDSGGRLSRGVGRVIADTLNENWKAVLISGIVYALFFGILDGIFIYQPGVDFYSTYLVSGNTWRLSTCCGPAGFTPVAMYYLPAVHAGLQLIPFSVLMMTLISSLVGVNVALLIRAIRLTRRDSSKGLIGGVLGALLGLFTGCPTCAAAFLFSILAGSGATAFSIFVARYQPLIVLLTVPLLFGSIHFQAKSIRAFTQGCAV